MASTVLMIAYGINILLILFSVVGLTFNRVTRSTGFIGVICGSLGIAYMIWLGHVLAS